MAWDGPRCLAHREISIRKTMSVHNGMNKRMVTGNPTTTGRGEQHREGRATTSGERKAGGWQRAASLQDGINDNRGGGLCCSLPSWYHVGHPLHRVATDVGMAFGGWGMSARLRGQASGSCGLRPETQNGTWARNCATTPSTDDRYGFSKGDRTRQPRLPCGLVTPVTIPGRRLGCILADDTGVDKREAAVIMTATGTLHDPFIKFLHVVGGIYIKKPYRWSIWLYSGCRFSALFAIFTTIIGFGVVTPITVGQPCCTEHDTPLSPP
ncbi:hypothetical protein EDB84DRAFT_1441286 [Lactarius hengduanensis]|nr:hypothetical protein EDB84DRAFT_1441286 [Lactarius hengduanensis]